MPECDAFSHSGCYTFDGISSTIRNITRVLKSCGASAYIHSFYINRYITNNYLFVFDEYLSDYWDDKKLVHNI